MATFRRRAKQSNNHEPNPLRANNVVVSDAVHPVAPPRCDIFVVVCVAIVCLFISPIGCVAFVAGLYASDSDWVHFDDLHTIANAGAARLATRGLGKTQVSPD